MNQQGPDERPPYLMAGVTAALVLILYVLTIAPTTQFWDTSEYIAAAKILGIPHPPGNPLFVLIANVWGRIPLVEHYALRINLLAAVTSALASGLLFLVAERFLRQVVPVRQIRWVAALAGVVVGAASFTVWNQSTVNEKVYTVSMFSMALVLWLAVRWGDTPSGPKRDRLLLLVIYLLALTTGNHLMGLLVTPAVLILVLAEEPLTVLRWDLIWKGLALVAVGLSVYAFLRIRAPHFPAINEGEPTNWDALWSVLSREQYQKPPLTDRQAPLLDQMAHFWQYFTWQYAKDWSGNIRTILTVLFVALGLGGAVRQWQVNRRHAAAMTALMFTLTFLLVFYLNFRFGYSMRPGESVAREVRERDYFFVASFHLWGVWVALGLGTLMTLIQRLLNGPIGERRAWYTASAVALVALVPLVGNRESAPRSGETLARDFAVDLLNSMEPYAIVITAGDNDVFPLWYAQEVEGVRRDVTVANQSLLNTDWHLRQLQRRELPDFVPGDTVGLYDGRTWPKPRDPPFAATMDQLERLPPVTSVPQGAQTRFGDVTISINRSMLTRSDIAVLQLIRDNLGKRPVYFARTTGAYADQAFGLTPYLLGQGLVRKLVPREIQPSDSVVASPNFGWNDMATTRRLLFDVYHYETAARDRPQGWVDRPSEGILTLYALVYSDYAQTLASVTAPSDSTALEEALRANAIARAVLENQSIPLQID